MRSISYLEWKCKSETVVELVAGMHMDTSLVSDHFRNVLVSKTIHDCSLILSNKRDEIAPIFGAMILINLRFLMATFEKQKEIDKIYATAYLSKERHPKYNNVDIISVKRKVVSI